LYVRRVAGRYCLIPGLFRKWLPKDRFALAWLFDISERKLPGWMRLFEFILRRQAKTAGFKSLDRTLTKRSSNSDYRLKIRKQDGRPALFIIILNIIP